MYKHLLFAGLVCIWSHLAEGRTLENHINDLLKNKADNTEESDATLDNKAPIVKRDVSQNELAKFLLEELIKAYDREDSRSEPNFEGPQEEVVHKRKSLWQNIGGPLPVATRLASFGSKIEPDGSRVSSHAFKAMRYGRRR